MRAPIAAVLAALALAAPIAGCGRSQSDETPVACLDGTSAYASALAAAPGAVRLGGGTPISDCLAENQDGGDLAGVGEAMVATATKLNAEARAEPGGDANLQLGYLLGAAQRGADKTEGIHTDLVRRLTVAARYAPGNQPLSPAFLAAYREGFDAGHTRAAEAAVNWSETATSIPDQVRAACAWVAGRAHSVRVERGAIEAYAAALPNHADLPDPDPATQLLDGDREARAAFAICLNAINFGSGWWPTIRKRPGHSGYFTIAAGLTERFRIGGPWTARDLSRISATEVATVVGQDSSHLLMTQFATSLRDVGEHLLAEHGGSFEAAVDAADGSAVALAGLLAEWQAFADLSAYDERPIPFYKRAELAAADIDRAGVAALPDLDRLTAFADNLVPHVLRVDDILRLTPALAEAIDAGELLVHGGPEEVELRACAVRAVELLSAATCGRLSPPDIDAALWNRGGEPRYKAIPRPRSRSTAY